MTTLRPCKFVFDMYEDRVYDGFALGTTWNGFDNVAVTADVARQMDREAEWAEDDADAIRFADMPVGDDGLINIGNGWTTVIVDEKDTLSELAQAALPIDDAEWGSDRQIAAENAFGAAIENILGSDSDALRG